MLGTHYERMLSRDKMPRFYWPTGSLLSSRVLNSAHTGDWQLSRRQLSRTLATIRVPDSFFESDNTPGRRLDSSLNEYIYN